ncbi:phosphotransferase [Ornithinimicrobium pratense]|uniref:Phosphotransferase n=1 Tax=Ornithinimicrobium pratense TaxID=2593973 RepID=A0A5J6V2V3_9MICO|nr:phosphotransferase [Ornithinimicrobium pratense]QFG67492.1 phosphotransferase [Ornithinimicrobium pratense]
MSSQAPRARRGPALPPSVRRRLAPARRVISGVAARFATWMDPGQASSGSGPPVVEDRLAAALDIVAQIEASAEVLPEASGPVRLWGRGRVARRPQVHPAVAGLIPRPERQGWEADNPEVRELWSTTAADLVVMAKFDVHERTKLRAAYGEEGLTLAVQPKSPTGVDGIARIVRAHEVVSQHAPHLMTDVLGYGRLPSGLPFVVERWLEGQPLGTSTELTAAAPEILAGLSAVHRGHGFTRVRLSEHWAPLADRWAQTRTIGLIPDGLGGWVERLIARDATMRHSWVHGDLVASNVIRTGERLVLIDWEHSQQAPIMNDAAKLHLFVADPAQLLGAVLDVFDDTGERGPGEAGAYSPVEELALAHAQLISHYPRRSAQLVGHPRAGAYDKQVRRQVERLAEVKDAG